MDAPVEAILDRKAQLLKPKKLKAVGKPPREFTPNFVVDLPVDQRESVDQGFHSRSPIDENRSGRTAMQEDKSIRTCIESYPDAVRHRCR